MGPPVIRVLLVPITHLIADGSTAVLVTEERARLGRFTDRGARNAFLAGRVLMRRTLGARLGCAPEAVPIAIAPRGKPVLACARPIPFNLAHSRHSVALAIGSAGPVGIDIEPVDRPSDLAAVAATAFSPHERAVLGGAASSPEVFFRIWTAKEAVAKAVGTGLGADPRGFGLVGPPPEPGGGPVLARDHAGQDWWVAARRIGPEICAVATDRPDAALAFEGPDGDPI